MTRTYELWRAVALVGLLLIFAITVAGCGGGGASIGSGSAGPGRLSSGSIETTPTFRPRISTSWSRYRYWESREQHGWKTVGDPSTNTQFALAGFSPADGTLSFRYNPTDEPASVANEAPAAIQRAMATWAAPLKKAAPFALAMLSPTAAPAAANVTGPDGVSVIAWSRFDESVQTGVATSDRTGPTVVDEYGSAGDRPKPLAQAIVWVVDGRVVEADILLNLNEMWLVNPAIVAGDTAAQGIPGAYDLQTVLTHELGHVLGLDHIVIDDAVDGNEADGTMYGSINMGESLYQTLTPGDLAGLAALRRK